MQEPEEAQIEKKTAKFPIGKIAEAAKNHYAITGEMMDDSGVLRTAVNLLILVQEGIIKSKHKSSISHIKLKKLLEYGSLTGISNSWTWKETSAVMYYADAIKQMSDVEKMAFVNTLRDIGKNVMKKMGDDSQ